MELYHIHLLGNHDNMYKENTEFIINKDLYNNRLYNRVMNLNFSVQSTEFINTVSVLNNFFISNGYSQIGKEINLDMVISAYLGARTIEDPIKMLNAAKDILFTAAMAKRELSMESYRKDNCPDKPSRMHSLYACSEEGMNYWIGALDRGNYDIYRIEALDDTFVTNEQLLPPENSSYIDSYNSSIRYFNPKNKDLNNYTNEYLVQGKVKILEKVDEIR